MASTRGFPGTHRFELLRTLGAGGMGVVYEALDRESDSRVALKTIRLPSADRLARFKNEFRTLQDLQHPNLVRLDELFESDGIWFFTMELVDGVDLLHYVRRDDGATCDVPGRGSTGPLLTVSSALLDSAADEDARDADEAPYTDTVQIAAPQPAPSRAGAADEPTGGRLRTGTTIDQHRLRDALRQLVLALCALHDAGKVHRDVKPGNILVTRDGRVVLLDFGLIADAAAAPREHRAPGTVAFMAPEQLSGGGGGTAADWYAVGVTLYEALTGRRPFVGSAQDIIELKQYADPVPPSQVVDGVPADLDALCLELLSRDPTRRPDAPEILRRLGIRRPPVLGRRMRPALFGRERELAALRAAYGEVVRRRPMTVLVGGESGVGKSVLVRAFLDEIGGSAALTLAGRCYERETVPYKAFDAVMEALAQALGELPEAELAPLLPERVELLANMFPTQRQVAAIDAAARAAKLFETRRADAFQTRVAIFSVLRALWSRLAARSPLVVVIDDLQWADADSLSLLGHLTRPPDAPPFLLLATVRTARDADGLDLATLRSHIGGELREVHVERLGADAAQALAASLLTGAAPDERTIRAVAAEAQGHPMFIEALIRHRLAHPDAIGPTRLDEALVARTEDLAPQAARLLELVCVAGVPVRQEVSADALGVPFGALAPLIASLRAASLVKTHGLRRGASIEAYHDRVRESVVARLRDEPRRRAHQQLAAALERSGDGDPELLAFHLRESGDPRRASDHAERAAIRARAALAFDRAARLYRMALDLDADDAERAHRLRVGLAEALGNAGHGAESAEVYLAATEHAPAEQQVELRRHAAEQLLLSGRIDDGMREMRAVLAAIGIRMPKTRRRALAVLAVNRARIWLRGADLGVRLRDAADLSANELMRLDVCWSMAVGMAIVDPIRGADFQARHLLLALDTGEPFRIACAVAAEASFSAGNGGPAWPRTSYLVTMAARLAETCGRPEALGQAAFAAALAEYGVGRFGPGEELFERAEAIFRSRCAGVVWWIDTAQYLSLECLYYGGRISELCRRVPVALADAEGRGDLFAAANFQLGMPHTSWLFRDDVDGARRHIAAGIAGWSTDGFHMQHEAAQVAQVNTLLYTGDAPAAHRRMREVWRAYSRSAIFTIQLARIAGYHERARAALGAAVVGGDREELIAEARHAAKRLAHERMPWSLAFAALARAGAHAADGAPDASLAELDTAIATFDAAHMALYAAVARLRKGELLGGDEGLALIAGAAAWMRAEGIVRPDRVTAMLAPGFYTQGTGHRRVAAKRTTRLA
jgi:eukaryotic-like serine/threonine-protein kinase